MQCSRGDQSQRRTAGQPTTTQLPTSSNIVIPANAGIHGRTCRLNERLLCELPSQTMDSRVRGNEKVGVVQVVQRPTGRRNIRFPTNNQIGYIMPFEGNRHGPQPRRHPAPHLATS